jgi:hypothetical protein
MAKTPYVVVCAALGLMLGWIPRFFHGPIPAKFDIFYLDGAVLVWGFYVARSMIGLLVGITLLPRAWYVRGPLCGALVMVPLGFVSLATPGCGGV